MPTLTRERPDLDLFSAYDSPYDFLRLFGRVSDPLHGSIPFEMWPHLRLLLDTWQQHRLTVCLKARQLGVSWGVAGYALWTAMTQDQAHILMLSKGQKDATLLLAKARFLYNNLPDDIRAHVPLLKSNDSELSFGLYDSSIVALPSTRSAGRSHAATIVILDEHAFHEYAEDNFAAVKPTIDAGGQLIAISTANGIGNMFQQMWQKGGGDSAPADSGAWVGPEGGNGVVPIFLPWNSRPDRDSEWYAQQTREYPPHLLVQEYPRDAAEAFIVSGRPVFERSALEAMGHSATLPRLGLRIGEPLDAYDGRGLAIYALPDPETTYLIGADVAEGKLHGDASCAVVLDAATFEEVATLHGRWPLDRFSDALDALACAYGGLLAVERQNHGHAVLQMLRERQAARQNPSYTLYHHTPPLKTPVSPYQAANVQEAGWPTNTKTKPIMIDELEVAIRQRLVQVNSPEARDEMRHYQTFDDGSTGAPANKFDDRVMAWAIAWQMRKWQRLSAPRQSRRTLRVAGL